MINSVVLVGRTTKMPDIRTIKDDKKVATFTLAVTRNYKNKSGDYETDFVPVIAYRSVDFIEKYVGKGDMIAIRGSIQVRSYEKDGQKRTATEILAEEVQLIPSGTKKEDPKPKEFEGFDEIAEIQLPF